jgi:hypothetical protein
MSKDGVSASRPNVSDSNITSKRKTSWPFIFFITALVPVVAATILYQLDSFDPAPMPPDALTRHIIDVPARNDRMLEGSELVGVGDLKGPEDVAYEPKSGVIYTGCADGWINRVTVNDSVSHSVVEKWVYTGGRPLGIAFGRNNEVIVADGIKVYRKVVHLFYLSLFFKKKKIIFET